MAENELSENSGNLTVSHQDIERQVLTVEKGEPSNISHRVLGKQSKSTLVWDVILIVIILLGAYFRLVGIDWDQDHHLHPDERFLTMVASSISSVEHVSDYFNTDESTLNPNNRGYGFYVYGTLPLFIVRYIGEWIGWTGYSEIHLVGRFLSALFDLMIIFLVYLISMRLYRNQFIALLASAFSAMSVMTIQLSHYFTVDNFANFFSCLAIYFAVIVMTQKHEANDEASPNDVELINHGLEMDNPVLVEAGEIQEEKTEEYSKYSFSFTKETWKNALPYLFFGLALGMAMASKISTAPLAVMLPTAVLINLYRQKPEERQKQEIPMLTFMAAAAVISFLVFRVFQPYAFNGPGFFNISLNDNWLSSIADLSAQSHGDVDFPPALQWARRPYTFALDNMVRWGLGFPLGILACAGFIWMGIRCIRGEWKQHGLIWAWTGIYFVWQSINFTRSMRYQIPVYPTVAVIAAWAIIQLWNLRRTDHQKQKTAGLIENIRLNWNRYLAVFTGVMVVAGTFLWAFAFTRIYTRPVSRVSASEWIYQNVPGPLNLKIDTEDGVKNQPLSYPLGVTVSQEEPLIVAFKPQANGVVTEIEFSYIIEENPDDEMETIVAKISNQRIDGVELTSTYLTDAFNSNLGDQRGTEYKLTFSEPVDIHQEMTYYLSLMPATTGNSIKISGPMIASIASGETAIHQILPEPVNTLHAGEEILLDFKAIYEGDLQEIEIPHIVDWEGIDEEKSILFSLSERDKQEGNSSSVVITGKFIAGDDIRGDGYVVRFSDTIHLQKDTQYLLSIVHQDGPGSLAVYGSRQANESSWDDALPISLHGYSPFDYSKGIYRTELNFEMYWDDNAEKRQRFVDTLEQADYIFITSSRQWGSTVRVPERYPMTTEYYRNLIGCPDDQDVLWCYQVADRGMFEGGLGFELAAVFQSEPNIGPVHFNTQFAEEAFSVYDHPKVLIFKKTQDYDSAAVRSFFDSIDLTKVVHTTPVKTKSYPGNLMLPDNIWSIQQAGGTWAQLFDRNSIFNRNQIAGVILWYMFICLLGWICYPITRIVLGGLNDKGYPFARLIGMLMMAYFSWLGASWELPFSKAAIWSMFGILLLFNLVLFLMQKTDIVDEITQKKNYFLLIEFISLAFFLTFLLIRLGNPDLWHPYKGGEKPMDFSYLNAILKSTKFPPYNPWFAGGYINYYYYGFVLVGVLVKALGIVPSIAYNFILPTLFSLFALGAFSIGWNLIEKATSRKKAETAESTVEPSFESELSEIVEQDTGGHFHGMKKHSIYAGLGASIGSLMLGNLGTIRMIWQGFEKLAAPGGNINDAGFLQRILWIPQGIIRFIKGVPFSYYKGDWYWIPSRVYQENAITEFPMFSFLYADLHAHLIALPVTLLAIGWAMSVLFTKTDVNERAAYRIFRYGLTFILGGIIIGALRPMNTWDFPTYLVLASVIVFFRFGFRPLHEGNILSKIPVVYQHLVAGFGSVLFLVFLSFGLYSPFSHWYGQGYNAINLWEGQHADLPSYLVHWGLFLFMIASWMIWETIEWMKNTPASSLSKLKPHKISILIAITLFVVAIFTVLYLGIWIGIVALPLMVWAGVLLLKPGLSDEKRFVLFLTGTALFLTLAVELIVLQGDIGRMNTVFKFYLQAWTMLSLSAAVSMIWLLSESGRNWSQGLVSGWSVIAIILVAGAGMFPVLATVDKIKDRMAENTPLTLDGMDYMQYSQYNDAIASNIDLYYDYQAIVWMQENVSGSPVIVEANTPEYRWGNRFTIYTGLPGVVGWNWHQRQQLAVVSSDRVTQRVDEIKGFYESVDFEQTIDFLSKYNVQYVILGQYEEAYYPGVGLEKFSAWDGQLWEEVYRNEETAIYKVIE